jgi:hypothetical protein
MLSRSPLSAGRRRAQPTSWIRFAQALLTPPGGRCRALSLEGVIRNPLQEGAYRRLIVSRFHGMSSAIIAPIEELPGEERTILLWRVEQFRRLGFAETAAWLLAESEADLGIARRLHRGGCQLETALRILL